MGRRHGDEGGSIERIPVTSGRRGWTRDTARVLRKSLTPAEVALWAWLRGRGPGGYRFRRQQPIGPYIVDFYCAAARLIVEIDGAVHDLQEEYDWERQASLEGAGYRVVRFANERVIQDLPSVLRGIQRAIAEEPSQQST
jgi:very-short-patch-repair endonuclease